MKMLLLPLTLWIGVAVFLILSAAVNSQLSIKNTVTALLWPFLMFGSNGRDRLLQMIKSTQGY